MRRHQRARWWLIRELDRLGDERQCDESRKPCLITSKFGRAAVDRMIEPQIKPRLPS